MASWTYSSCPRENCRKGWNSMRPALTISGTPCRLPKLLMDYALTATDADGDAEDLVFSLMVEEDVNPGFTGEVQNQTWIQNSEIPVLEFAGCGRG